MNDIKSIGEYSPTNIDEVYDLEDLKVEDIVNDWLLKQSDDDVDYFLVSLYDSELNKRNIRPSEEITFIDGDFVIDKSKNFRKVISVIPKSRKRQIAYDIRLFYENMIMLNHQKRDVDDIITYSLGKYYFSMIEADINKYSSRYEGVPNKNYLKDRIKEELSASELNINKIKAQFSNVYRIAMDLNGLKSINDNFDHSKGDLYLEICKDALSQIIDELLEKYDNQFSIELTIEGGDEFGFLIINKEGSRTLNADVVEYIRQYVSQRVTEIASPLMSEFDFSSDDIIKNLFGNVVFQKYINHGSLPDSVIERIDALKNYKMEMQISCGANNLSEVLNFVINGDDFSEENTAQYDSVSKKFKNEIEKLRKDYLDGKLPDIFKDSSRLNYLMGMFLSMSDDSMGIHKKAFKKILSRSNSVDDYILYRLYSRNEESIELMNEVELIKKDSIAVLKKQFEEDGTCPVCGNKK